MFSPFLPHPSCAFVSNLDDASATPALAPDQDVMRLALQADLAMNVFRDGRWGVFRHQLINQGTLPAGLQPSAFQSVVHQVKDANSPPIPV